MERHELEAADRLSADLMWMDFTRIFNKDRDSLVSMLLDIKQQMEYPSITAHYTPEDHGNTRKRGGFFRRVLSKLKG